MWRTAVVAAEAGVGVGQRERVVERYDAVRGVDARAGVGARAGGEYQDGGPTGRPWGRWISCRRTSQGLCHRGDTSNHAKRAQDACGAARRGHGG